MKICIECLRPTAVEPLCVKCLDRAAEEYFGIKKGIIAETFGDDEDTTEDDWENEDIDKALEFWSQEP